MDERYMRRALELARLARGRTSPNPMVGAVVVKNGEIVGEGWHQKAGTPHAEIHALRAAAENARDAELFVTLEPCCHSGRTGPCTEAVVAAGIRRVIVAMTDPNPKVAGQGITCLREHGIEVSTGVLAPEAADLNAAFIKWISCGLPFVVLKSGMSLDGKIATATGESKWITGPESRLAVHRLRDSVDVIMTGIGTVLADDPELTTRLPEGGRSPVRVILDRMARLPLEAKILADGVSPVIIVVSTDAPADRVASLERNGAEVLRMQTDVSGVDLHTTLRALGERCYSSVLVEAGGTLNGALLKQNLVDRMVLFMAPRIIGGSSAPGPFGGEGIKLLSDAVELEDIEISRTGQDIMVSGYVKRREARDVYRTCRGIGTGTFGGPTDSVHSADGAGAKGSG